MRLVVNVVGQLVNSDPPCRKIVSGFFDDDYIQTKNVVNQNQRRLKITSITDYSDVRSNWSFTHKYTRTSVSEKGWCLGSWAKWISSRHSKQDTAFTSIMEFYTKEGKKILKTPLLLASAALRSNFICKCHTTPLGVSWYDNVLRDNGYLQCRGTSR